MYVYASGSSATIQFKYCIDNIETSYKYTAKISNKDGLKVTRSSIKLSKVYDKTLRNKILDRVYKYETVNDLPSSYDTGIERESYYLYDYSSKSLSAEYVYFKLGFDTDEYLVYDIVETASIDWPYPDNGDFKSVEALIMPETKQIRQIAAMRLCSNSLPILPWNTFPDRDYPHSISYKIESNSLNLF